MGHLVSGPRPQRRWTMTTATTDTSAVGPGRGGRMSRPRKREAVLRLLRGEDLETVSRSLGVTAAALTAWRDAFLAAGEAALATRPADGETLASERLKARLGEMLLRQELLGEKKDGPGAGRPFGPRRAGRRGGRKSKPPWRPPPLGPEGGGGDEPDALAVRRQAVRARAGLPHLGRRRPLDRLPSSRAAAPGRPAATR